MESTCIHQFAVYTLTKTHLEIDNAHTAPHSIPKESKIHTNKHNQESKSPFNKNFKPIKKEVENVLEMV